MTDRELKPWHLAHPPKDNIDERIAICGGDGPVYAIWEHWQQEYAKDMCDECRKIHLARLRDLGRRLYIASCGEHCPRESEGNDEL